MTINNGTKKKSERPKPRRYTFYPWTSRDPIVRLTNELLEGQKSAAVSRKSGVAPSTIANLKKLKTRRPQFTTIAGIWGSQGKRTIPIDT